MAQRALVAPRREHQQPRAYCSDNSIWSRCTFPGPVHLLPHHKSGTAASWEVFAVLCCRRALAVRHAQLGGALASCERLCRTEHNLSLHWNGLSYRRWPIERESVAVHFVRSPRRRG